MKTYDLHTPWCPEHCLIGTTAEELLEIRDDLTEEILDAMKVDDYRALDEDDTNLYRRS